MRTHLVKKTLLVAAVAFASTAASAATSVNGGDLAADAMKDGAPVVVDLGSAETQMNKSMLIDVAPPPPTHETTTTKKGKRGTIKK